MCSRGGRSIRLCPENFNRLARRWFERLVLRTILGFYVVPLGTALEPYYAVAFPLALVLSFVPIDKPVRMLAVLLSVGLITRC